jgi:iron complex transport system substrate-binding protein
MIAGTGSFVADIVRKVGGEPVGPSGTLFVKANPETLVTLNPDVIIVNGSKGDVAGAVALSKDPRLQSVKAIKNGRIRAIESDVLLRRGGRVDLLISGIMRALAAPAK